MIGIEWEWQALDGAMTNASFGGAASGPNPTDRAKQGVKRGLLTDGGGIPLAVAIDGANRHDMKLVVAALGGGANPRVDQPLPSVVGPLGEEGRELFGACPARLRPAHFLQMPRFGISSKLGLSFYVALYENCHTDSVEHPLDWWAYGGYPAVMRELRRTEAIACYRVHQKIGEYHRRTGDPIWCPLDNGGFAKLRRAITQGQELDNDPV